MEQRQEKDRAGLDCLPEYSVRGLPGLARRLYLSSVFAETGPQGESTATPNLLSILKGLLFLPPGLPLNMGSFILFVWSLLISCGKINCLFIHGLIPSACHIVTLNVE